MLTLASSKGHELLPNGDALFGGEIRFVHVALRYRTLKTQQGSVVVSKKRSD